MPRAAVAQHQLQRALLLDIVVSEGAAVLQLLAREDDEALLVGRDCPPCSGVPAAASLHTKSVIGHACY